MAPSIPGTQGNQRLLVKSPLRKANEVNDLLETRAAIKLKIIKEEDEKGRGVGAVASTTPIVDSLYSHPITPLLDSTECFDSFVDFGKLQSREFTLWTDSEHNIQKCGLFANLATNMTLKELLLGDKQLRVIRTIKLEHDTLLEWTLIKEHLVGEYGLGRCIRSSGIAKIYSGTFRPDGTSVVIKKLDKRTLGPEHYVNGVLRERVFLEHFKLNPHPNIIEMRDWWEDEGDAYLVMPHIPNSIDLFDLIEQNDYLDEQTIKHLFKQIASAVNHLHNNNVVHRDIKDENVIIDLKEMSCKLIDFGSAAFITQDKTGTRDEFKSFYGTIDYCPPEILEGTPYTGIPQDIYALGILLYCMTYKEVPFRNVAEITENALNMPFKSGSTELIKKMVTKDAGTRIGMEQVLQDAWLSNSADLGNYRARD